MALRSVTQFWANFCYDLFTRLKLGWHILFRSVILQDGKKLGSSASWELLRSEFICTPFTPWINCHVNQIVRQMEVVSLWNHKSISPKLFFRISVVAISAATAERLPWERKVFRLISFLLATKMEKSARRFNLLGLYQLGIKQWSYNKRHVNLRAAFAFSFGIPRQGSFWDYHR